MTLFVHFSGIPCGRCIRYLPLVILMLFVLFPPSRALSQEAVKAPDFHPGEEIIRLEGVERSYSRDGFDLEKIEAVLADLKALQVKAEECIKETTASLDQVTLGLDSLGPVVPGELPEIARQRKGLLKEKSGYEARLSQCRFLLGQAQSLAEVLNRSRQILMARSFWAREADVLSLTEDVIRNRDQIPGFIREIGNKSGLLDLDLRRWLIVLAVVGASGIFAVFRRRRILVSFKEEKGRCLHAVLMRFSLSFLAHLPIFAGCAVLFLCMSTGKGGATAAWESLAGVATVAVFCLFLARMVVKPLLLPVGPLPALLFPNRPLPRRVFMLGEIIIVIFLLGAAGDHMVEIGLFPDLFSGAYDVVMLCAAVLVVYVLIYRIPVVMGWEERAGHVRRAAFVLAILLIGAGGAGYRNLSWFIFTGLIATGVVLALLFVANRFAGGFLTGVIEGWEPWQERIRRSIRVERGARMLSFLFLRIFIQTLFVFCAVFALSWIWSPTGKGFGYISSLIFQGFPLGAFRVIPFRILIGIIGFLVIWFLVRWLKGLLETKWLDGSKYEPGALEALVTIAGYAGFVIAAVFALSLAGFDLSKLAIIAGALSVGIGFGLQNIVNNFVSGLILLFERPIKRGDWVVVGSTEGYVKKIRVRSTVITTFDRADVIVPNSELLSNQVTNWMFDFPEGRVHIIIGVAYGSDLELVRKVLFDVAMSHPEVVKDGSFPNPVVWLKDFADSSINFDLNFYIRKVDKRLSVSSEIRYAIEEAFRKHGISIPFPQRDLYIKNWPKDSKEYLTTEDTEK